MDGTTPAQFLAEHGDLATWTATDFEVYDHLLTAAQADQLAEVLAEHCVVDGPAPTVA
ncbi:hypothetical protein [Streptomyces litchfieldiae]|uniref:Uncharacterized protein n=1 Tax=Streptomyces litchfieldiae TaxID=3075543 RepID=A0ABU2N0X0_9ACTN|nr:hypothetical protein [Streptomyces sp. DSM 44938]MDT0347552.1 hypothetical protein [Streptomyces sp. DSM 44938]